MEAEKRTSAADGAGVSPEMIEAFMKQRQVYMAAIKEITTKLEILDEDFKVSHAYNPIHHIESRLKRPESIWKKLNRKNTAATTGKISDYVQDIAGVRVICNYIEDIYTIADLLTGQRDIELLRRRDYIMYPKENGYRSLHLLIKVPVFLSSGVQQVKAEVQIRTIAMDFWASLEHHLRYKAEDEISDDLRRRLKESAEKISEIDMEMQSIYRELRKTRKSEK